jgi:hypothetical protein
MLFIFGVRSTVTGSTVLEQCLCPNCGQENTLTTVFTANYFHFFFVPFFPTGKSCVITCSYCRKQYDDKYLPPPIGEAVERFRLSQKKRPAWHCCGCSFLLILFFVWLVMLIFSIIFHTSEPERPNPLEDKYKSDFEKLTTSPDCKTDTISCAIKSYLDVVVTEEMDRDAFEYFSRVDGDKVLVLMKVTDMKKIESGVRKDLVNEIGYILRNKYGFDDEKIYIGVEGKWNTVLISTPDHKELGGNFANEEYLYDFYEQKIGKNEAIIDTANIKAIEIK